MTNDSELIEWVEKYADVLFRRALFLTSHRETAEDLVQETFLAAAQQLSKFQRRSSPKTWLFSILHHKTADYFRKKFQQPTTEFSDSFFNEDGHWNGTHAPSFDWHDAPPHLLDQADFQKVLQNCLSKLPQHWRAAFLLKFLEGKRGEVICQELQLSKTNFWQILHRTKLQLRACLEKNWFST